MGQTFGRFHTTRLLARTEYADVYEAEDDDGRRYALKALRIEGVERALVDALFQREIAALDGFEHEAIVPSADCTASRTERRSSSSTSSPASRAWRRFSSALLTA